MEVWRAPAYGDSVRRHAGPTEISRQRPGPRYLAACQPGGINFGGNYEVIAVDEATQAVSNIARVWAPCGTGLGQSAPFPPPSPALSGSLKDGLISASGSHFTPAAGADITFYFGGQPVGTVHTTATGPCHTTLCLIPGELFASFSIGSSGCDGRGSTYTIVALDEATHSLSNEVSLGNTCTGPS